MSLAWQINKKISCLSKFAGLFAVCCSSIINSGFFSLAFITFFYILINEIKQFAQLRLVFLSFGRRQHFFLKSFISEHKNEELNVNFAVFSRDLTLKKSSRMQIR